MYYVVFKINQYFIVVTFLLENSNFFQIFFPQCDMQNSVAIQDLFLCNLKVKANATLAFFFLSNHRLVTKFDQKGILTVVIPERKKL